MPDQIGGSLSYNRIRTTTTAPVTLAHEYRANIPLTGNQAKVAWYSDLDPTCVAQVSSVTIQAGTTGDVYVISIGDTDGTEQYFWVQQAGDTAATIAGKLAARVDADMRISAAVDSIDTSKIVIKGIIPGKSFTVAKTGATTVANLTIATTTAASGSAKHAQVAEVTHVFSILENGKPRIQTSVQWYNAAVPTSVPAQSPVTTNSDGPVDFDTIQTAAGVARPA